MKFLAVCLCLFAGFLGSHAGAQARETGTLPLSIEVGGGYTVIHANAGPGQCGCFFMPGFDAQAGIFGSSRFSALVDVGDRKSVV